MIKMDTITKRLLPLYLGSFLQGVVFFYAIEKLFIRSLSISDAELGILVAIMTALILVLEIPSGILSDRWSRKGTIILGLVALIASAIVTGTSESIVGIGIGFSLWGIYDAMYSGVYESIIYDTLIDEDHTTDDYEKYFGRNDILASAGLVVGALGSSLIVSFWSFNATYFATIPFIILAIFATSKFKEPTHHKEQQESRLIQHMRETISDVVGKPELYWLLASLFASAVLATFILEYSQLWLIALGISAVLFGPIDAVLLTSFGLAGAAAQYFKSNKMLLWMTGVSLILSFGLIAQSVPLVLIGQVIVLILVLIIDLVLGKRLQDSLRSSVRSGASSVVSTLSKFFIIPGLIAFGFISDRSTVFTAAYLAVGSAILLAIAVFMTTRPTQGRTAK